jgi:hypothetical protein
MRVKIIKENKISRWRECRNNVHEVTHPGELSAEPAKTKKYGAENEPTDNENKYALGIPPDVEHRILLGPPGVEEHSDYKSRYRHADKREEVSQEVAKSDE